MSFRTHVGQIRLCYVFGMSKDLNAIKCYQTARVCRLQSHCFYVLQKQCFVPWLNAGEHFFFTPDFFIFSFTSLSSFFTHIEKNQSVGGAKTGVSREKRTDTPASRTWLVHMTLAPSEAQTHSGEIIE